jgi:hypothetical protein
VSLVAPTDGATVIVSQITVLGTITPASAALRVSGRRVVVRHGSFTTPISLRKGITHISISASARGFVGSSTVISVRYTPRRVTQQASSGAGTGGYGAANAAKAELIASCSSDGNVSYCTCVVDRLFSAGFNTQAKWQAVVVNWRRTFLANGSISYPPVMRRAIVACANLA